MDLNRLSNELSKELPADFVKSLKSTWKGHAKVWSFLCPLCKSDRRIKYSPKPQPRHYVQIGLTAVFFTLVTWTWFEWKGIVSFLPFWLLFESIYRSRVRAEMSCPHCGFDPYLFLTDINLAKKEVETYWRKKFAEKGIPYPVKDLKGGWKKPATSPAASNDGAQPEHENDAPTR